jgi:hypothetical protein
MSEAIALLTEDHTLSSGCHRCIDIITWLASQERGRTSRCPLCGTSYSKGRQWVINDARIPFNEQWSKSDRPAYCHSCHWRGPMKETVFHDGECFPHRCPGCAAAVRNKLGEE